MELYLYEIYLQISRLGPPLQQTIIKLYILNIMFILITIKTDNTINVNF